MSGGAAAAKSDTSQIAIIVENSKQKKERKSHQIFGSKSLADLAAVLAIDKE